MQWYETLLVVLASIIALYVIVSAVASTKFANMLVKPETRSYQLSRDITENVEKVSLYDYDNVWDKHPMEIVTKEGYRLCAMYVRNANATTINGRAKVAIISHGHICNHIHSIKYAIPFYNMGYNIVMYDQRYFGHSEGDICTLGLHETQDLVIVIDKTLEIFGNDAYIALHGESMGAATVLNTLQHRQDKIAYAVADCGYSKSTSQYAECCWNEGHFPAYPAIWFCRMRLRAKYDYDMRLVNPIQSVSKVNTPICYIHGDKDKLVLPHHSIDMYAVTNNKKYSRLNIVANAVHARSHLLDKVAYNKLVTEYIMLIEDKDTHKEN